ncbi:MAG: hypothetical protein KA327_12270 [Pseudarcicella sp.]|nr:hypothetical protein [Pseudarcicella sp.]
MKKYMIPIVLALVSVGLSNCSSLEKIGVCDKYKGTETWFTGEALDENNKPVEGVHFIFSGVNDTRNLPGISTTISTFLTDSTGKFNFGGKTPESTCYFNFKVSPPNKYELVSQNRLPKVNPEDFEWEPNKTNKITIRLKKN